MDENQDATRYEWRPWKMAVVGLASLLVVVGAAIGWLGDDPKGAPSTTNIADGGGAGGTDPGASGIRSPGAEGFGPSIPPSGGDPETGPGSTDVAPPETNAVTDADGSIEWSPALLRGGFSFLVAFAVAYALRTFMRIAIFFLGVWGASMFLLANLGWIDVHWDAIDAAFSGWAGGIGGQFENFGRFVTGSLPVTGLAGLGFYTGIKRK